MPTTETGHSDLWKDVVDAIHDQSCALNDAEHRSPDVKLRLTIDALVFVSHERNSDPEYIAYQLVKERTRRQ